MPHFKCPKCSGKYEPAGRIDCSYCNIDSNTGTGMYDNSHPKQPEIAVSRETGVASESRNHLVPNSMPLDCKVTVQNREGNKSNYQTIKKIVQELRANKQSRQEISKKTDSNRDLVHETSAATNRMPTGNSQHSLTSFNDLQQQVDIRKSLLNTESQWNIGQFHGSQKDDAPVKSSDSSKSVAEGAHSKDDIPAIPGPSGFPGNQNETNMLEKQLKSSSTSEIQKVVPRRIITCKICGEDIHKHTKIQSEKYSYFCCVCKYETNETPNILQKHIRIHCSKNDCNVCSKEYTEGPLHVSQQRCHLCRVTFRCRTQLDEHLLEHHGEYFRKNCWECWSPISNHYTRKEGKKLYFCCMCGYETNNRSNAQLHNKAHRPKTFCKICREDYPEEQKGFHNIKYLCINCEKEFKCKSQLEDHYKEDFSCIEHFSEYCMLCNETISKHGVECEENEYYKCCACQYVDKFKCNLLIHVYTHTSLRMFKCGTCGNRYETEGGLINHSKKCIPLPFLCEICRARFPSKDSLNKHCLEKHRLT